MLPTAVYAIFAGVNFAFGTMPVTGINVIHVQVYLLWSGATSAGQKWYRWGTKGSWGLGSLVGVEYFTIIKGSFIFAIFLIVFEILAYTISVQNQELSTLRHKLYWNTIVQHVIQSLGLLLGMTAGYSPINHYLPHPNDLTVAVHPHWLVDITSAKLLNQVLLMFLIVPG